MSAETTTVRHGAPRRWIMPVVLVSLATGLCSLVPAPQAALAASQRVASISAGGEHACAIVSGEAYCWGENYNGELGDGANINSGLPVAVDTSGVLAGKTLTQITAGYEHTCALDSTGTAYCWGLNAYGQLGDGSTTSSNVPVAVDISGVLAGQTLTQITVGVVNTCALDSAGDAYCWGWNAFGQLGDGTTTSSSVPVAVQTSGVLAGKALTQITAGGYDACALDSAGDAYCWGWNTSGQLGDGTTTNSSVPVAVDTGGVLAGKALTQITAGRDHTCAVTTADVAYCWGYNHFGELGDGSTTNSSVPVAVNTGGVLAGKVLTQITAGLWHTCVLDATGGTYCWGRNASSELGDDGTGSQSSVPVLVGL